MTRELLSKQNVDFMERAREVADKHIRPIAAKHDVEQTYPWSFQKAVKEAGLSGVWIPKFAIHDDSELYGIKPDQCAGRLVVREDIAVEKGLV